MLPWTEIGDRIFVRRYAFLDQNIGVILGDGAALVIDTRSTYRQAREILADLQRLTRDPVEVVVDTHGHFDHAFGNAAFRPAAIWGHVDCGPFMASTGDTRRSELMAGQPDMADDLRAVVIDPPDHAFRDRAIIEVGDRSVELLFLGRGHTDHDIVVTVPDDKVLFGGDLIENGAVPSFGDSYPIDWPVTVDRLVPLVDGVAVPGHGNPGGRDWVREQASALHALAGLAQRVNAGELTLDDAVGETPYPEYPAEAIRQPLERALRQVRGEPLGPRRPRTET